MAPRVEWDHNMGPKFYMDIYKENSFKIFLKSNNRTMASGINMQASTDNADSKFDSVPGTLGRDRHSRESNF